MARREHPLQAAEPPSLDPRTWNRAVASVPGWPRHKLRSSCGHVPYTLPFSSYPAPFQADVERFAAARISGSNADAIVGDDVFATDGGAAALPAHRPVQATTLRSRLFQIRMSTAALVLSGTPSTAITSLRSLVQPVGNARAIISFI